MMNRYCELTVMLAIEGDLAPRDLNAIRSVTLPLRYSNTKRRAPNRHVLLMDLNKQVADLAREMNLLASLGASLGVRVSVVTNQWTVQSEVPGQVVDLLRRVPSATFSVSFSFIPESEE